jgi:CRISPR-associated Cas5-like protein
MKALVFDIRLNSLYSLRIPFTWQSALTYPILPASAVIGMLANALQRYKNNKHPVYYLKLIEEEVLMARSRLKRPAVLKSYITSAVIKWQDNFPGGKFTNALGREYAYSKMMQILAIFNSESLIEDITESLQVTPLTCGDSESPISLEGEISINEAFEVSEEEVVTEFPVPFKKETKIIEGNGKVYLMHERCQKKGNNFPLISYLVPVKEEQGILKPSYLKVKITDERVIEIKDIGKIIL